jgi:hypothetical protein
MEGSWITGANAAGSHKKIMVMDERCNCCMISGMLAEFKV